MSYDCQTVHEYLRGFSLAYSCDVINDGALRIATPFTYPNGSRIDVFLNSKHGLLGTSVLSDYGQTHDYLSDLSLNPFGTKKRQKIINEITESLGVRFQYNAFEIEMLREELPNLAEAIVRLAQACIRVTDLIYTQRLATFSTFTDEVEEFLAQEELSYDRDPTDLIGIYNVPVPIDFRVHSPSRDALVQTWSTRNITTSHTVSNEIFVRWHDLKPYRSNANFISVYDDESAQIRGEDLARLNEASLVFGFPHQQERLAEFLRS